MLSFLGMVCLLPRDRIIVEAMAKSNPPGSIARALPAVLTAALAALLLLGCATDERRARELREEAQRLVDEDRLEEAVLVYEEILTRYPETETARKARDELETYRNLTQAIDRYPSHSSLDVMVRTGRAIERHRWRRGAYPESLRVLVPDFLDEVPVDPWGRELRYRRKGPTRGYVLACYGSDGEPGGEGEARDLIADNGRWVDRPRGPLP